MARRRPTALSHNFATTFAVTELGAGVHNSWIIWGRRSLILLNYLRGKAENRECAICASSVAPIADTILIGERGTPLLVDSLSTAVRNQLRKMGVDGYVIHGLRKNAAVELINAGCRDAEVMAITGHKTAAMVAHYSKKRDQRELASAAMDKWEQSGKLKNRAG